MYKFLLCWRYLRTRFLAFVCIGSVMLGVATLIVVNAVMSGFSTKLKDRMHKMISDVVIESPNLQGFPLPMDVMMKRIQNSQAGSYIEAMAPTIETIAMVRYRYPNGEQAVRPVKIIGCDPASMNKVGGFSQYLTQPARRENPNFDLDEGGLVNFSRMYPKVPQKPDFPKINPLADLEKDDLPPVPPPMEEEEIQLPGIVVGYAMASWRDTDDQGNVKETFVLHPGQAVQIMTMGVGKDRPEPVHSNFVICDYIKTELGEQDSNFVFVDMAFLARLRGMENRCTSIQMKLKDYAHAEKVVTELKKLFPGYEYMTLRGKTNNRLFWRRLMSNAGS
jgi:lipoprotein-releasing system permease protein